MMSWFRIIFALFEEKKFEFTLHKNALNLFNLIEFIRFGFEGRLFL